MSVFSTIIYMRNKTFCHLFGFVAVFLNCRLNYIAEHRYIYIQMDRILAMAQRRFFGLLSLSLSLIRMNVCVCVKFSHICYAIRCFVSIKFILLCMLCILFYNCRILYRIRMQRSRAQHSTLRSPPSFHSFDMWIFSVAFSCWCCCWWCFFFSLAICFVLYFFSSLSSIYPTWVALSYRLFVFVLCASCVFFCHRFSFSFSYSIHTLDGSKFFESVKQIININPKLVYMQS